MRNGLSGGLSIKKWSFMGFSHHSGGVTCPRPRAQLKRSGGVTWGWPREIRSIHEMCAKKKTKRNLLNSFSRRWREKSYTILSRWCHSVAFTKESCLIFKGCYVQFVVHSCIRALFFSWTFLVVIYSKTIAFIPTKKEFVAKKATCATSQNDGSAAGVSNDSFCQIPFHEVEVRIRQSE